MMELSPIRYIAKEKRRGRRRRSIRLKLSLAWQRIKRSVSTTMLKHKLHIHRLGAKQLSKIRQQELQVKVEKTQVSTSTSTKSLANLLVMPNYTASDFIDRGHQMTPTMSPRENMSKKWREIHGVNNWEGLLDPLHSWLRREVIKYGEFVEGVYDALDFDPLSEYCGSSRHNRHKLFEELGLVKHGYKVTKYIYAMSHVDVPSWFVTSRLGESWSKDSNWMGYVAVSGDKESERIGRRDVVVAWRGTITPTEWYHDLKTKQKKFTKKEKRVKVQEGFRSIYKSKSEATRFNKQSASQQVMEEVKRIVKFFRERGEEVSLTCCGHSLGGALSLLTAYEAAKELPDLFISVITFGAPRAGNMAFREKLKEMGVKTLRIEIKQDIVPKLPGLLFNQILDKINVVASKFNFVYRHVGTQLKLDFYSSPYLKRDADLAGSHNLEVYLHLLDGFLSKKSKFRFNAKRDVASVNKGTDMLIEELKIPECWYQVPHKGLVLNKYGRWVKPGRAPEDIPSPLTAEIGRDFKFSGESLSEKSHLVMIPENIRLADPTR